MPKEINDFISKIILSCFVLTARNNSGEEVHMGTLKLGRLFASRLQTQRLGEDNYSSMKQQFLLAYWVSFPLATNQIAHYINGPIESAVAHLGVVNSRQIWSACSMSRVKQQSPFTCTGQLSKSWNCCQWNTVNKLNTSRVLETTAATFWLSQWGFYFVWHCNSVYL